MATVNLSVNVGENKTITFHSGGTYNPEDIVFDVSANGSGYKPIQTAVSSPSASSTATAFIDTISQNTNGVITATKKNLPTASSTVAGITKVGATGGAAAYGHTHATSIATSTGTNQITLAFGTKYSISAGGSSYVFTMPANPNSDTKVTQTYAAESNYNYWRPLVIGYSSNATEGFTPSTSTDTTYTFSTLTCQPSSGTIRAKSFKIIGGKSSQFLKADGSVDSSSYSLSNHTHTLSIESSNDASQITLTHNTKFKISAGGSSYVFTTPSLPFASDTVTGITKVGAAGGAAAYGHTHATSIATSTGTNQITLAFGTKYAISAGGSSYVFTMPANPNTNTTYSFATGDANGQIKVTPSGGSAQNVSVKGLGSAAYTESSAYATSTHTHGYITSTGGLSQNATIANGDCLVITDTSDSAKMKRTSIAFGTSTTKFLRNDGTWATPLGGTSGGASTPNHEHDLSIVADSNATSQITLAHNTKYKLSAGGSEYVFTTPRIYTANSNVAGITKVGAAGGAAAYDHTHGNVSSGGAVSTNTSIESGDHLLITDSSDSNKIKGTSITFGSSTTTYLRNDGTWGTPSGGGGGSTVSANNITLSTSAQTYVTVNGNSKTIKLPDVCPWDNIDVPLALPMFDGDEKGSVIPIAKVTNSVLINGDVKAQYEISPVLMFPISIETEEAYALPVYMDVNGHLFILLNQPFAEFLRNMNYSTSSEY